MKVNSMKTKEKCLLKFLYIEQMMFNTFPQLKNFESVASENECSYEWFPDYVTKRLTYLYITHIPNSKPRKTTLRFNRKQTQ